MKHKIILWQDYKAFRSLYRYVFLVRRDETLVVGNVEDHGVLFLCDKAEGNVATFEEKYNTYLDSGRHIDPDDLKLVVAAGSINPATKVVTEWKSSYLRVQTPREMQANIQREINAIDLGLLKFGG